MLEQQRSSVSSQPCLVMKVLWPQLQHKRKNIIMPKCSQRKQSWSGAISNLLTIYRLFYKRVMQKCCADVQALKGWREVHDPEKTNIQIK